MFKKMFLFAAIACVGFVALAQESKTAEPSDTTPASCSVKIDGMTCGGCVTGAQKALLEIPGVINAKVDLASGIGEVEYDPKLIKPSDLLIAKLPETQSIAIVETGSQQKKKE